MPVVNVLDSETKELRETNPESSGKTKASLWSTSLRTEIRGFESSLFRERKENAFATPSNLFKKAVVSISPRLE